MVSFISPHLVRKLFSCGLSKLDVQLPGHGEPTHRCKWYITCWDVEGDRIHLGTFNRAHLASVIYCKLIRIYKMQMGSAQKEISKAPPNLPLLIKVLMISSGSWVVLFTAGSWPVRGLKRGSHIEGSVAHETFEQHRCRHISCSQGMARASWGQLSILIPRPDCTRVDCSLLREGPWSSNTKDHCTEKDLRAISPPVWRSFLAHKSSIHSATFYVRLVFTM